MNFRLAVAKNIPLGDVQFEWRGPDTGTRPRQWSRFHFANCVGIMHWVQSLLVDDCVPFQIDNQSIRNMVGESMI